MSKSLVLNVADIEEEEALHILKVLEVGGSPKRHATLENRTRTFRLPLHHGRLEQTADHKNWYSAIFNKCPCTSFAYWIFKKVSVYLSSNPQIISGPFNTVIICKTLFFFYLRAFSHILTTHPVYLWINQYQSMCGRHICIKCHYYSPIPSNYNTQRYNNPATFLKIISNKRSSTYT